MVLVQREAQLAQLCTAFDNCAHLQGGHVCLITSGIGNGKTALLEAFASHVTQQSARLLSAISSPSERDLPFGVMDQLIASSGSKQASVRHVTTAVEHLGLTASHAAPGAEPRTDPTVASPGADPGERVGDPDDPTRLHAASSMPASISAVHRLFTSLLLDLARPVPLALTIDDVQHADHASLQCLLYAIRRLRHMRIMVVLTESSTLRTPHPHFRAELMSQPHFSRIHLDPLTDVGLTRMANTHPLPETRSDLARRGPALTGGSPLLMRALLDDEAAVSATVAEPPSHVPGAFGDGVPEPDPAMRTSDGPFAQAVLRSLYRHEPEVRGAAQALAVLGRPTPLAVLARLLSVTPEFTTSALQLLSQSGLVDGDQFRHPLVAATVLADLRADERRRLHRRAATVLHEHGAEPGVIAEHLVRADWAEAHWAERALQGAAAQFLGAGRPDVTGACLRLIHRDRTPATPWTESDALLLCSRWQINPLSAIAELDTADISCGSSPAALAAVAPLLWQGRADAACAIVDAVAALPDPPPKQAARLETARLLVSLFYPDRYQEARSTAHAHAATSLTDRSLDAMVLLADALGTDPGTRDVAATAELMIQRYLADDGALGLLVPLLITMLCAGRPHLVAEWTRLLLDRPAVAYAPSWKAIVHALHAEAALRLGALEEADEHARTALTLMTPQAWGVAVAAPLGTLVTTAARAGRLEDADRWLAKPVPAETFRTPFGPHYLAARARYHLAAGRRSAAVDDLHRCSQDLGNWRMDTTTLVPWRLELARIHIALGDRKEAARLLEEQLDIGPARSVDDGTRGAALRLLANVAPAERSRPLLEQAVRLLEASGDRVELARALADSARVLRQAGDTSAARPLHQRAHRLAQGTGISVPAQRTARPASGVGLYRAQPHPTRQYTKNGLSQAERRVAALAAQGHTNRQISSKLFITVSTVEQHLTRIYRKLDVKQRTDLATRLASMGAGGLQRAD